MTNSVCFPEIIRNICVQVPSRTVSQRISWTDGPTDVYKLAHFHDEATSDVIFSEREGPGN